MKKLTKDQWRARGVFNSYSLCQRGGKRFYVAYMGRPGGRSVQVAKWQVVMPGGQTDPGAHWSNGGCKTFIAGGRAEKEAQRLEAVKWASERYAIDGEWERDPWGGWHPAGALEAARSASTAECVKVP